MRMSPQTTRTRGTIRRRPVYSRPLAASASSSGRTRRETSLHQNPLPRCTSRMATNSVEPRGFHRTDTTDFGVVLSGNLALQLDDGAEVSLSPGDVLIENGTRHRWRVVGD